MSPDQSKPEGSLKKQLISLGIIVVLVIGGWYLSAFVSELIFQRGEYESVSELSETPWVDVDLDAIAPTIGRPTGPGSPTRSPPTG